MASAICWRLLGEFFIARASTLRSRASGLAARPSESLWLGAEHTLASVLVFTSDRIYIYQLHHNAGALRKSS
jgi:hypothetical protein